MTSINELMRREGSHSSKNFNPYFIMGAKLWSYRLFCYQKNWFTINLVYDAKWHGTLCII